MTDIDLNPEQQLVVQHHYGPIRVASVAGSGKTLAIVERVAHLIRKRHVSPTDILMISFSRIAATEMKRRINKRLPGIGADKCVRTFHSLGLMIFKEEIDRHDEMEIDTSGLLYIKAGAEAYRSMSIQPEKKALKKFASTVKNDLIGTNETLRRLGRIDPRMARIAEDVCADAAIGPADVIEAFYKTEEIRTKTGVNHNGTRRRFVTFDDMIYETAMALKRTDVRKRWAKRWQFVLQDEAQDMCTSQDAIAEALCRDHQNYMVVGDPTQCHPPGVMIQTAPGASAPVERLWALQESQRVHTMGWNRHAQKMVGGRRATLSARHYIGDVIDMEVDVGALAPHTRTVPMTPNHRVLCRWSDRSVTTCVTYLMYRKDLGFRVGWCKLFSHQGDGNNRPFHLGQRTRTEKAEHVWILATHESRTDASVHESIVALKYGIPTVTFEPVHGAKHMTRESLDRIFAAYRESDPTHHRGAECLEAHDRNFLYPLYPYNNGGVRGTYFEVFAINLEPGLMSVALADMRGKKAWTPISRISRRPYNGEVFSLDVEKDHSYAANGIVVLNSIYAFRGARPDKLLTFHEEWSSAKTVVMHRNYRSGTSIVALANSIVECMPADTVITDDMGFATEMTSERNTQSYVGYHLFPSAKAEAEAVADNIQAHHNEGLKWSDQAVLLRMNVMTRSIEVALAEREIPYKLVSGQSFFTLREAKIVFGYLRVLAGRADEDAIEQSLMYPSRKLGRAFVKSIVEAKSADNTWFDAVETVRLKSKPYQSAAVLEWLLMMKREQAAVRRGDFAVFVTMFFERLRLKDWLKRQSGDEEDSKSAENLKEVIEFASGHGSVDQLLNALDRVEAHRAANSRKRDAVTVSTVHRIKGAERKVIYLIEVAAGRFPPNFSDIIEERRIFYVAITRAMDELWISCPCRHVITNNSDVSMESPLVLELDLKPSPGYRKGRATAALPVGSQVGLAL